MSQNRAEPQEASFWDLIREGKKEEVHRILQNVSNNDELNFMLKKKHGQYKETALHLAVKYGHEGIVKLLLKYGADIHATDLHKRTALHTAADPDENVEINTKIIALILGCKDADVNAMDGYGNTPVKLVAEKGHHSAVKLLIENGADIELADKWENTTLHVAAKKGHKEVLALLLEKLPNKRLIGKQNQSNCTPLHLAVERQSRQCVAMLLNAGADSTIDTKTQQGQTAAELAKDHGDKVIIDLLKDPKKAKEFLQRIQPHKSASMPQLGRGCSVEADSPLGNQPRQLSLQGMEGAVQLPPNAIPVVVNAEQVFYHMEYKTTVSENGNAAIGPNSQVNVQDPTAMASPQLPHAPTGESHYHVNVTGGNAAVGDYSTTNVGIAAARTPSTAGSNDEPFSFPQSEENRETSTGLVTGTHPSGESSGAPTENPNSAEETAEKLSQPVPEESPADKSNASLRNPIQEDSPTGKPDASLSRPVQDESPPGKVNTSLNSPVQEESPPGKVNTSLNSPVQEESPPGKVNTSLNSPVQEESPPGKVNTSLNSPVQEESPPGKVNTSLNSPVQEESPPGKVNTSLNSPVQEESPPGKVNTSLNSPVQEESPPEKVNTSLNSPVQEDSPPGKVNTSLNSPVQEESPPGKVNTSLNSPVQEESPSGKVNTPLNSPIQKASPPGKVNTSLNSPVQEESPPGKVSPSLKSPIQEEFPPAKANTSLPYSGPEDKPAHKPDKPVSSSCSEELCTSVHFMSLKTEIKSVVPPAKDHRSTGDTASIDADEAARTATNSASFDQPGAVKENSRSTSFKAGQAWQQNVGSRSQRNASSMTRSVPKEAQDRLLKEVVNSPSSEISGLDEFCSVPEPTNSSGEKGLQSGQHQWANVVKKEKAIGSSAVQLPRASLKKSPGPSMLMAFPAPPNSDVKPNTSISASQNMSSGGSGASLPRASLKKSPGPSMLMAFPAPQKSDVKPNTCTTVSQNPASLNAGAFNFEPSPGAVASDLNSSLSARSSSSKEARHRKERHFREVVIPDGPLPSGADTDGKESMTTSRNGEALPANNHARNEHSPGLRENLDSERSSTAEDPSVVVLMPRDSDPEHDRKGHEKCEPGCCLM